MQRPRKLRRAHTRGALRAVVDESIALFHRLRWVAEQIYGEEGRKAARRGVLRGLVRYGPQTVPALARVRAVSRQNVQTIVDALHREHFVALTPNPRHARSPLVCATPAGEAAVRRMDETDDRVLRAAGRGIPREELERTAETLRALRLAFENDGRWRGALG